MIWLTWRQFRAQAITTTLILTTLTLYLLYLGTTTRNAYNTDILGCVNNCSLDDAKLRFIQAYDSFVIIPSVIVIALPAVIGIFWGAPLITRELETNTHRLVWNQSITRTRWLTTKLTIIGLIAITTTATLTLLLTWAASRYDQINGNRFDTISFASRNIAPLGYITFAFILGTTLGIFIRRTVPTMAATLLILGITQLLLPSLTRPHLRPPVTQSMVFEHGGPGRNGGVLDIGPGTGPSTVLGYAISGCADAQRRGAAAERRRQEGVRPGRPDLPEGQQRGPVLVQFRAGSIGNVHRRTEFAFRGRNSAREPLLVVPMAGGRHILRRRNPVVRPGILANPAPGLTAAHQRFAGGPRRATVRCGASA